MIPTYNKKQNMITGTVIRPTHAGVFPKIAPGLYSVALGNMSQFDIFHHPVRGGLLVGVVGKGCYVFDRGHHYGYIQEKLKVMDGDAANIADQLGDMSKRQGRYDEKLTTPDSK